MELLGRALRSENAIALPQPGSDVPALVDALLKQARDARATDLHLVPAADALEVFWRIDGVLERVANWPRELAPRIAARFKVLAGLLTYRTDLPQEGRVHEAPGEQQGQETRVSTFPTLFGEKVVARLFAEAGQFHNLEDLGLPAEVLASLREALDETSGVIIICGPAGSGKTTTAYASLRALARSTREGRSLVSLEDPIETVVPGVAQSQVNPVAGFTMATGLRSLLRQDPEVILVGEIRDADTAETVFQAALTGHLVLTTFHAGSSANAVNRLSDMGVEPYLLRSGVRAILCQRLLRRLCGCAVPAEQDEARLGLPVESTRLPAGCQACRGTGYAGRFLLAELLLPRQTSLGRAILAREEAARIEQAAVAAGMVTQWQRGCQAVADGLTSALELTRALGRQPAAARQG
jgi:type II secretory ATPase GspE/PulE/Tfp pilus assembly ATPase PilB-like protein